jgi:hypothetical protein
VKVGRAAADAVIHAWQQWLRLFEANHRRPIPPELVQQVADAHL